VNFAELTATANQTVSFYTAHFEETVDILVFFPPINQQLYLFEGDFMEIGSNCSSHSGQEIPRSDTKSIGFRLSVDTTLALCSDSSVIAASYHLFPNISIAEDEDVSRCFRVGARGLQTRAISHISCGITLQISFTSLVDFTDASQSPTRTLEVGPGAGLDGTGLLVLVGEPGTAFFTGALPRDAASFAFDLGDACETTMANDTDFPIAILALEEPMDQAVYACRLNQVTRRV
jgi:hypothetical protein